MVYINRLVILALLLLAVLALPVAAVAAPTPAQDILKVDPPRVDVAIRPGEKFQGMMVVTNTSSSSATVRFYTVDRRVQPKGNTDLVKGLKLPTSAAQWISTYQYDELLKPGERKEFPWSLSIPEDATVAAGDYVAVVFAEVISKGPPVVAAPERAGTMIVASVPGQPTVSGKVTMLSSPADRVVILPKLLPRIPQVGFTLPPQLRLPHPQSAEFSFINEGTSRTRAVGSLVVSSGGRVVAEIPAGSADEVFPGDAADFAATWSNVPDYGAFTVTARVDVGGIRSAEDSFSIYVFPLPLAVAVLAGLVLLVVSFVLIRRLMAAREFHELEYLGDYSDKEPVTGGREPRQTRSRAEMRSTPLLRASYSRPVRASAVQAGQQVGPGLPVGSAPATQTQPMVPPLDQWTPPVAATPALNQTSVPLSQADPVPPSSPPAAAQPPEAAPLATPLAHARQPDVIGRPQGDPAGGSRLGVSAEVERLLAAGLAAMRLDAQQEAHRYFCAAVARDPGCLQGWLLRAGTASASGEAEECLNRALSIDPANPWALEGLRLLASAPRQPAIN